MSFRVRLAKAAEADLERRLNALAERSPGAARRLNDRFESALIRLRDFPFPCGRAYENASFAEELRHPLFRIHPQRKYRALFVVQDDEIIVLAVRAPGERPVESDDIER
jgi:plasmid stabilization system protein ParE